MGLSPALELRWSMMAWARRDKRRRPCVTPRVRLCPRASRRTTGHLLCAGLAIRQPDRVSISAG